MAKLTSVVAPDLTNIVATFNADMDAASLNGRENWTCVRSTVGAMVAEVIDAVVQTGDRIVHILVGPGLSPDETYTLEAINAEDALGNILPEVDRELAFVAPSVLAETLVPYSPLLNLEAVTQALGETLQDRTGPAATFLLQPIQDGDTDVVVESTLLFPDSGAFFVDNFRFNYTSKGQMTFYGVTPDPAYAWPRNPLAQYALLVGDTKTGETTAFAYEQALRDTVFMTAAGVAFDVLVAMYGIPRPSWAPQEDWRLAAKEVVWNVRGVMGSMLGFLYHALPKTTIEVDRDPAKPQALIGIWTVADVSRLYRLEDKLYWSVGITAGDLMLCPVETGFWHRADFSALPAPDTVDVEQLSWTFDAGNGMFRIYVADATIDVPPSYLGAQAYWGAQEVVDTPGISRWLWLFGGPSAFDDISSTPAATNGLVTSTAIPAAWAGTWRNLYFNAPAHVSGNRGGSYTANMYVNGVLVATVVLGASATSAVWTGTLTLAENDSIALEIVAGGTVIYPLEQPRVSCTIDAAGSQPEAFLGVPYSLTDPPNPLYLASSEFDVGFAGTVQRLLAAGIWSEVRLVEPLTRTGY